jgi:hypothetical protein
MVTTTHQIIEGIKTILNNNTYLSDPWETASGSKRGNWWHTDRPLTSATYPRGQVLKSRKDSAILDFGYDKLNTLLVRLYFYTKTDFGITISGEKLTNERLCEYMAEQIEDVLETYRDDIADTWGIKVSISDEPISLPQEDLYVIGITARIFYFKIR